MSQDTKTEHWAEDRIAQQKRTIDLLTDRIRMLEEENHSFASQLKDKGVDVRESSRASLELPPPFTTPLKKNGEEFQHLSRSEHRAAEEALGDRPVFFLSKCDTTVDVGHWLSGGVVWAAATESEVVLFSAGRRPFIEEIPFTHLYKSLYNHITGEVIFAPAEAESLTRIRLSPVHGYQLLAQIYQENLDA
ncbi:MAG: hypothetical protein QF437_21650 [Planctomycetota bacterium]|nr:hypothetical protein [Planctomycetota bacterium]MDP7133116.1 hypothetical protein [Planctomycetota bacterium]